MCEVYLRQIIKGSESSISVLRWGANVGKHSAQDVWSKEVVVVKTAKARAVSSTPAPLGRTAHCIVELDTASEACVGGKQEARSEISC